MMASPHGTQGPKYLDLYFFDFRFLGLVPSHVGASLPDGTSPRVLELDCCLVDAFSKTDTQMTTSPHVPTRRLLSLKPPCENCKPPKPPSIENGLNQLNITVGWNTIQPLKRMNQSGFE